MFYSARVSEVPQGMLYLRKSVVNGPLAIPAQLLVERQSRRLAHEIQSTLSITILFITILSL